MVMKADLMWSPSIGMTHSHNVERAFWLLEQMERLGKRFGKLLQHWRTQISEFCETRLVRVKESLIYALGQIYSGPMSERLYNQLEQQALFSPVKTCSLGSMSPDLQAAIKRTILFPVPELGGTELAAWHIRAQPGMPTILFHHGRQHNISQLGSFFTEMKQKGFGIFAYDYPGFGRSEGQSKVATIHHAAQAAQEELTRRGVPFNQQIVMGHSFGGAVAVDHLARLSADSPEKPKALVVINTLSGMDDVLYSHSQDYRAFSWVLQRYPELMQRFPNLREFFNLREKIALVAQKNIPILVLHADHDKVFPEKLGRDLHASAQEAASILPQAVQLGGKAVSSTPIEYRVLEGGHRLRRHICEQAAGHLEDFLALLPTKAATSLRVR